MRPVAVSHLVEFELTVSALPAVGVGLLNGVERIESVFEVGNLRKLTIGCSCDVGCSYEDVIVCVAGHVSLLEVLARCLSWPWWLALSRSLYCLIALGFDDLSFRRNPFQDYVMEVGSLKRSASEAVGVLGCHELPSLKLVGAVGAVRCPELPSPKFVGAVGAVGGCDLQSVEIAGAVGCLCMFVLLLMFVKRLVAVRWFRRKRYVRRWRAVSVRLEAMMRPVSRDRTQVLVTNQKRQTQICDTLSLLLGHVKSVLELALVCGRYTCILCGATDLDFPDVDSEILSICAWEEL